MEENHIPVLNNLVGGNVSTWRVFLRWGFGVIFALMALTPFSSSAALINGDFSEGLSGWEELSTGGIYVEDGSAVLTEGEANPVSLAQTFLLKSPTSTLSVALSVKLTPYDGVNPPDAFQVSLLDDGKASLIDAIPGYPGELLHIQPDGTIHYAPGVTINGAPASGSVWSPWPTVFFVMTVDLSAITEDVNATLAFDLTGFDGGTSEARVRSVQTLAVPVAFNDTGVLNEDTPTTIAVLANDVDPDGPDGKPDPATATLTIVTLPLHGNAAIQTEGSAQGTILYTPDPNYAGADAFSYKITDASGYDSGTAAVSMTVTAVNDLPVASAGPDRAVREGTVVTLDGSASTDVENPTGLVFAWTQLQGSTATLSDPAAKSPTATLPEVSPPGELLVFQLKVVDTAGSEVVDTVSLQVSDYVIPCDVNDDKKVDLADAIILLRVMARLPNTGVTLALAADADGDGLLGLPEAIGALQTLAGLRE